MQEVKNTTKTTTERKLPRRDSQNYKTLKHLALYGPLSTVEAYNKYFISRLPNCISRLRNHYNFKIEQVTVKSNVNRLVKWEKYYMEPEEQEIAKKMLGYM